MLLDLLKQQDSDQKERPRTLTEEMKRKNAEFMGETYDMLTHGGIWVWEETGYVFAKDEARKALVALTKEGYDAFLSILPENYEEVSGVRLIVDN